MDRDKVIKELYKKCGETICSKCVLYNRLDNAGTELCYFDLLNDDKLKLVYYKMIDQQTPTNTSNSSNVDHPSHYNQGSIECIDAMLSAFGKDEVKSFCKLNAFKYIWRSKFKRDLEDIKKANWYISKFVELSKPDGTSETGERRETN